MHMTLYVGGLAPHEDGRELARLFCAYGTVAYAKVVIDPDLLRRHGEFGVVEMDTTQGARDAMRALDGLKFHGRTLCVRAATAEEETAAGHPRMYESMNIPDAPDAPNQEQS